MHSTLTVSFSWFNYGTLGKSTTPYLIEIKVVWWEFIMLNWMSVVDFTKPFSECIICIGLTWQKMKRDVVWIQIYLNDWNITEVYTWQGSKMMYIGNETNEGGLGWKARGVQATRASLLKYICLWSFPPFIPPPPLPPLVVLYPCCYVALCIEKVQRQARRCFSHPVSLLSRKLLCCCSVEAQPLNQQASLSTFDVSLSPFDLSSTLIYTFFAYSRFTGINIDSCSVSVIKFSMSYVEESIE